MNTETNSYPEILKTSVNSYVEMLKNKNSGLLNNRLPKSEKTYDTCYCLTSKGHIKTCTFYNSESGFKNRFVQHYPNCVSAEEDDYATLDFNTQEELLNFDYISDWKKNTADDKFYRYSLSVSKYKLDKPMLMAEYNEGKMWWVIGFLRTVEGLDLPIWKKNEK